MFTALQALGRKIGSNLRSRRSTDDEQHNDFERPRIRIVSSKQGAAQQSKSRWFGSGSSFDKSSQELLQQQQQQQDNATGSTTTNDTSNAIVNDTNSTDLPLLYSLARSWAWEAVTFRCTTHPHEVDVQYRDYRGDTSLHWVAFGRPPYETVHELLLKCPKLASTPNYFNTLPIHVACSYRASSAVIQKILHTYPEAAAVPDSNGATPLHQLCDYGSGTGNETIASVMVILRCYPYGIQSVMMIDSRYQRRPLYILNARKNIREQEQHIETIRSKRFRQRAIRNTTTLMEEWNHALKYELVDQLEDDISNISQSNNFWMLVSRLIVAEYICTFSGSFNYSVVNSTMERFFGNVAFEQVDEGETMILHAFVANLDCPPSLLEYAILLYEPYLMRPNPLVSCCDQSMSLPLHVAASMYSDTTDVTTFSSSIEQRSHLLSLLVDGCPMAASIRDANGQLPLGVLLLRHHHQQQQRAEMNGETSNNNNNNKKNVTHWSNGMQALIDAYPLAILDVSSMCTDRQPALWPHFLSQLSRNRNTIYTMLRADPTILLTSTSTCNQ